MTVKTSKHDRHHVWGERRLVTRIVGIIVALTAIFGSAYSIQLYATGLFVLKSDNELRVIHTKDELERLRITHVKDDCLLWQSETLRKLEAFGRRIDAGELLGFTDTMALETLEEDYKMYTKCVRDAIKRLEEGSKDEH